MSHRERDHAQGTVERGNDWLDGTLAGWLLFITINAGHFAWAGIRGGAARETVAMAMAAAVLALAAIFPLLRFHRIGWALGVLALGLMAAHEGLMLGGGEAGWRSTVVFLAIDLLGIAYLLWIIPEFWPPKHAEPGTPAPAATSVEPARSAAPAQSLPAEQSAAPAASVPDEPTPATRALAAIHHRIVAAGSACAVTSVSIRAEAGRFGVTPASLRTEGLALYRTFLGHFMADGALSPDEERELICLERALDLDDDGVWRLRAEAGLVGGTAPIFAAPALTQAATAADDADRHPPVTVPRVEGPAPSARPDAEPELAGTSPMERTAAAPDIGGTPPMDRQDAEPDLSAQADITSSLPRIHSPGTDAGTSAPDSSGVTTGPGTIAGTSISAPEPALELESASAPAFAPAPEPAMPASPFDSPAAGSDALADYEEHELGLLLAWAGIANLPGGAPRRTALERLRALHRTSTEPLDACASDHPLEAGEQCLSIRTVELYRVPRDAPSAGPAADVPGPVLDPLALVDGSLERERDLSAFQRTGVCRFLLTERRLLLVAPSGQQSPLPLSRVRAVQPFRNGLEVRPQTGHPVFLAFTGGVDDVAMRIDRASRDLHA